MADLNQMLLMNLLQSYAQQGNLQSDPFNPGQANVGTAGAQEAMGGGPGQMETPAEGGGAISPASQQWAEEYAKELGVDPKELLKPASGAIAKQLGVEGVTPDFAGMKQMMLNIAKGHAGLAQQGGVAPGPVQENPQLRGALAYQAMIENAKAQGGLGGRMVGNLSPLLAPRMMGPYLEQQAAAARQKAAVDQQLKIAKMQIELAQTAQLGELRRTQMAENVAQTKLAEARALKVGSKSYQLKGTPSTGGFVFDPETGDIVDRIEPALKGNAMAVPKPFNRKDPSTGDTYRVSYESYQAMWDHPEKPASKMLVEKAGSAREREQLSKLFVLAKQGLEKIPALYRKGLTGPGIGRALEQRKTGGIFGQAFGAVAAAGLLNEEDLKAATELQAALQVLNVAQTNFWSGTQVPEHEMERNRLSQGLITDYDVDFLPHLKASAQYLEDARKAWEAKTGVNLETGERFEAEAPLHSGFTGAPSTGNREKSQGVLTDRTSKTLGDRYGY